MSLLNVNAGVSPRNCDQSLRICELNGWSYLGDAGEIYAVEQNGATARLPNGSFALDQVVGLLEAEGCHYNPSRRQWIKSNMIKIADCSPHDLTAAMDAYIKVLEEKKK